MTVPFSDDISADTLDGKCVPVSTIHDGIVKTQLEAGVQATLEKADALRVDVPAATPARAGKARVVNTDGDAYTDADLATLAESLDNAVTLADLQAKTRDLHASDYPGTWDTADDAKIVVTTAVPPQLRAVVPAAAAWATATAQVTQAIPGNLRDTLVFLQLPVGASRSNYRVQRVSTGDNGASSTGTIDSSRWSGLSSSITSDYPAGLYEQVFEGDLGTHWNQIVWTVQKHSEDVHETEYKGIFDGTFSDESLTDIVTIDEMPPVEEADAYQRERLDAVGVTGTVGAFVDATAADLTNGYGFWGAAGLTDGASIESDPYVLPDGATPAGVDVVPMIQIPRGVNPDRLRLQHIRGGSVHDTMPRASDQWRRVTAPARADWQSHFTDRYQSIDTASLPLVVRDSFTMLAGDVVKLQIAPETFTLDGVASEESVNAVSVLAHDNRSILDGLEPEKVHEWRDLTDHDQQRGSIRLGISLNSSFALEENWLDAHHWDSGSNRGVYLGLYMPSGIDPDTYRIRTFDPNDRQAAEVTVARTGTDIWQEVGIRVPNISNDHHKFYVLQDEDGNEKHVTFAPGVRFQIQSSGETWRSGAVLANAAAIERNRVAIAANTAITEEVAPHLGALHNVENHLELIDRRTAAINLIDETKWRDVVDADGSEYGKFLIVPNGTVEAGYLDTDFDVDGYVAQRFTNSTGADIPMPGLIYAIPFDQISNLSNLRFAVKEADGQTLWSFSGSTLKEMPQPLQSGIANLPQNSAGYWTADSIPADPPDNRAFALRLDNERSLVLQEYATEQKPEWDGDLSDETIEEAGIRDANLFLASIEPIQITENPGNLVVSSVSSELAHSNYDIDPEAAASLENEHLLVEAIVRAKKLGYHNPLRIGMDVDFYFQRAQRVTTSGAILSMDIELHIKGKSTVINLLTVSNTIAEFTDVQTRVGSGVYDTSVTKTRRIDARIDVNRLPLEDDDILQIAFIGRNINAQARIRAQFRNTEISFEPAAIGNTPNTGGLVDDAGGIEWNLDEVHVAELTLIANRTLSIGGGQEGGVYMLVVKQDVTGSRTLTLHNDIDRGNEPAPVLSTDPNVIDSLLFARFMGKIRYMGIKRGYS